jgi:TRAP-type C4-dicarboxylate transport system substrate-binding protein
MRTSVRSHRVVAIVIACAVLGTGGWPAPALAQTPIVMKVATVNAGESPRNSAAYEFAKVVGEKSKGRIKAEVYINNQLARGEGATLEGIQLGTIDVAPVGSAPIGGVFEPAYLPLDLPFLWSTREQAWKVMDGPIGQSCSRRWRQRVKGSASAGAGASATCSRTSARSTPLTT